MTIGYYKLLVFAASSDPWAADRRHGRRHVAVGVADEHKRATKDKQREERCITDFTGDFWDDLGKQGGPLSKAANLIPGINATAALHDYWFNRPDHPEFITFNNVGTMLPAAAMTYGALLNGSLTVQMSAKRK